MADYSSRDVSVNDPDWVFYKDREEWQDVEPVPQDDGPHPVVSIAYPEKFVDVYNYFRAVVKSQEKSERVLELTKDALELNAANYTVWHYRRDVLLHLKKDLREELKYSRSVIEANEKNYQVWHHRRVIVEWLKDASQELELTEIMLSYDAKNYHAWQYRQWVVKAFNLFDKELYFIERLLKDDVRNNSAWSYRYFVIAYTTNFNRDSLEDEVHFTIGKIKMVPNNESAWNYLRGLMSHCQRESELYSLVCDFCEEFYEVDNIRSPHLLGYIIDLCEEISNYDPDHPFFNWTTALELCNQLANEYDKIRCHYWNYISRSLAYKMNKSSNSPNQSGDSATA